MEDCYIRLYKSLSCAFLLVVLKQKPEGEKNWLFIYNSKKEPEPVSHYFLGNLVKRRPTGRFSEILLEMDKQKPVNLLNLLCL